MPNALYYISLKLILRRADGKILGLKEYQGSYAGWYDLPGGRIAESEFKVPFVDILKREIQEELGNIKCKINPTPVAVGRHLTLAKFSKMGKDVPVFYLFFEGEYRSGKPKISDEHSELAWLDLGKPEKHFKSGLLDGLRIYLKGKK